MYKIPIGITLLVIGAILLLVDHRTSAKGAQTSGRPYLRNAGIGFILIGMINLIQGLFN